jgi:hypothetical protein
LIQINRAIALLAYRTRVLCLRYSEEGMRPPSPDNNHHATPHDLFLYLLAEMEAVMQRGTIRWDAESALSAQQRLDRVSAILRRIAAERRKH